jgi:hypothetical protein
MASTVGPRASAAAKDASLSGPPCARFRFGEEQVEPDRQRAVRRRRVNDAADLLARPRPAPEPGKARLVDCDDGHLAGVDFDRGDGLVAVVGLFAQAGERPVEGDMSRQQHCRQQHEGNRRLAYRG